MIVFASTLCVFINDTLNSVIPNRVSPTFLSLISEVGIDKPKLFKEAEGSEKAYNIQTFHLSLYGVQNIKGVPYTYSSSRENSYFLRLKYWAYMLRNTALK